MTVLTLGEAEAFAARTLAAIERMYGAAYARKERGDADRERVVSNIEGLRRHDDSQGDEWVDPDEGPQPSRCSWCTYDDRAIDWPCTDARRYSDGLRRTAALYGVTS